MLVLKFHLVYLIPYQVPCILRKPPRIFLTFNSGFESTILTISAFELPKDFQIPVKWTYPNLEYNGSEKKREEKDYIIKKKVFT